MVMMLEQVSDMIKYIFWAQIDQVEILNALLKKKNNEVRIVQEQD